MLLASDDLSRRIIGRVALWLSILGAVIIFGSFIAVVCLFLAGDAITEGVLLQGAGIVSGTIMTLVLLEAVQRFLKRRALRRLVRQAGAELSGILRPIPGDQLANFAPLAVQRPDKRVPGYCALASRTFDLELDDGRRVRVEPLVAILETKTDADSVPYGTRVTISSPAPPVTSYREAARVVRGTMEQPVVIRVGS